MSDEFSEPNADPDQDGLINLVEYALDSSPVINSRISNIDRISEILQNGNSFLTYSYKQRINVEGLQIILEISDDMINWNSGSNYLESIPSENDPEPGIETKSFRSMKPVNLNRSQFFRLKIVLE
jgi:hypothetical protein